MRYTTPEWLLENLEIRLQLALRQQSGLDGMIRSSVADTPDLPAELTRAASGQHAA